MAKKRPNKHLVRDVVSTPPPEDTECTEDGCTSTALPNKDKCVVHDGVLDPYPTPEGWTGP